MCFTDKCGTCHREFGWILGKFFCPTGTLQWLMFSFTESKWCLHDRFLHRMDVTKFCVTQAFSQIVSQVSCGWPLVKTFAALSFVQYRGSWPLGRCNTKSPNLVPSATHLKMLLTSFADHVTKRNGGFGDENADFPLLCTCSESSLTNVIGGEYKTLNQFLVLTKRSMAFEDEKYVIILKKNLFIFHMMRCKFFFNLSRSNSKACCDQILYELISCRKQEGNNNKRLH